MKLSSVPNQVSWIVVARPRGVGEKNANGEGLTPGGADGSTEPLRPVTPSSAALVTPPKLPPIATVVVALCRGGETANVALVESGFVVVGDHGRAGAAADERHDRRCPAARAR